MHSCVSLELGLQLYTDSCYHLLDCCRYKLRNIEETEAAKKMLQEKRLAGKTKSDANIPSSYNADFFHRGKDYTEKLRRGLYIYLSVFRLS